MQALILTGTGRYADPWHPYPRTSPLLAGVLAEAGFTVEAADDVDAALAWLDPRVHLVVVNAGDPHGPVPEGEPTGHDVATLAAAVARLEQAASTGVGILAMHSAAASLRDYPAYDRLLGGRWERGVSWHPPLDEARIHVVPGHPVTAGLDDFTVADERYTNLQMSAPVQVLAEHEVDGQRHPAAWAREVGASRLVYDALGHDERSYDCATHRRLIAQAADWLVASR